MNLFENPHFRLSDDAVALYATAAEQPLVVLPVSGAPFPLFAFRCYGCGENGGHKRARAAAEDANGHAGECRRVPLPSEEHGRFTWPA